MTTAYELLQAMKKFDACNPSVLFVQRFDANTPVMTVFYALPWERRGWLWDLVAQLTALQQDTLYSPLINTVSEWQFNIGIEIAEMHRDIVMPDFPETMTPRQMTNETIRRKNEYYNSIDRIWNVRKEAFWNEHGAEIEALIKAAQ